jgi:pimeloyl-ACP methyl ester carboxylesterase
VKIWLWTKRILTGVAALVAAAAISGAVYQAIATRADAKRFPARGTMVEIGGRRFHVQERGEGAPTVVFDAPLGASSLGWELVAPEVSKFTRTFVFDRGGYGWSDPGPGPRSSGQIVAELHEMLALSGAPSPYVLVGASVGGCTMRLYAFRYPRDVAGLVLVDPAHEDQFSRMSADKRPPLFPLRLFQGAARLGILRVAGMPVDIAGMNVLGPELQPAANAVGYRTDAVDAIVDETAAIDLSFDEVRAARKAAGPLPLRDLPLIVLTHRSAEPAQGDEAKAYAAWVELHAELAKESSRGRHVIVPKSEHFIAVDQPASVVDAIREVVASTR